MKVIYLVQSLALAVFMSAMTAQAHDPKEHMKAVQAPDCAAMNTTDHAKMDMNDPVMQAMMQQCKKDAHHDDAESEVEVDEHQAHHETPEE